MNNFLEKVIKENIEVEYNYLKELLTRYTDDELIDYIIGEVGGIQSFKKILDENYNVNYIESIVYNENRNKLKEIIPFDLIKEYKILPIILHDDNLYIAMANIFDYEKIYDIKSYLPDILNLRIVLAKKSLITDEIIKLQNETFIKDNNLNKEISLEDLIDDIFKYSIKNNASDIHIEPYDNEFYVRIRIDGELILKNKYNIDLHKKLISKIKIMAKVDISKKMIPQDGHFKLNIYNRNIDFRLSTMPTIFGEKAVLRIIYNENKFENKESLGFYDNDIKIIDEILQFTKGLVLVTGSTGSGKSTTLSLIIKSMDYHRKNIITVEEPVENIIKGVTQINLNEKAGLTFDNTLQYVLRQDPDIIMLGEIRNISTAQFAIRSSITGHLVLSTLHTNNAISTVTRLINMGIEPYMITSSLKGIISQKLIKKVCSKCKVRRETTLEENKILGIEKSIDVYSSIGTKTGCESCNNTGYKGRTVVYEILEINSKIKEKILNGYSLENSDFKVNFIDNIHKKLKSGEISIEEAIKIIFEIRYEFNE